MRLAPGERRRVTFRLAADALPCQADLDVTGETVVLAQGTRYFTDVSVD
jgi:hypothetical protein